MSSRRPQAQEAQFRGLVALTFLGSGFGATGHGRKFTSLGVRVFETVQWLGVAVLRGFQFVFGCLKLLHVSHL